jgi:dTDP-N-acetylfucosamine:lipid II N-acetylfucosaminyltransferase
MPKVLHISRDNKFLDFAINCFEQVNSVENYYLVVTEEGEISYINYEFISPSTLKIAKTKVADVEFISQFKTVIFHGISPVEQKILNQITTDIKVIWFGYGFDYYPLLDFFMVSYFDRKTKKIWYRDKNKLVKLVLKLNEIIPFWTFFKSKNQLKGLTRVDYFAPVLKQEYREIKKRHPNFAAKYIDWNYEIGDKIFSSLGDGFINGTNFLIGNSASITNNHLDVFDLLKPEKIGDNKIIAPLSYGFPKAYKNIIVHAGNAKFKSQFQILEDFIPFEEYLKTLRSCGFAVFGSIRQQALGNIYMSLALGIKVYLNKKNPILSELRSKGFVLFDFNDFKKETDFTKPLNLKDQKHNRELMRQMSMKENYLVKSINLIELIKTF